MKENFVIKGHWFLPKSDKTRVSGTLTYEVNGNSTLELIGNLDGDPFMSGLQEEDFILGITTDSKEVTLYKSFITHRSGAVLVSGSEVGIPTTKYIVNYILVGAHIKSALDMKFQNITTEIYNLDEWVSISGFDTKSDKTKKEFDVSYKLPDQINFKVDGNVNGQFNFVITPPPRHFITKKIEVEQRTQVIFSSEIEYGFEDLLEYVFRFQNFLVLGLYRKTYPTYIEISGKRFKEQHGFDKRKTPKKILVYPNISMNIKELTKPLEFRDMLFNYHVIKENLDDILVSWFKNYIKLEASFNLLFEQFYNNSRFSENTFLNLAQAAETFHAQTHNRTKLPPEEFKAMRDDIIKLTPIKYHDWLKGQFNFGNNLNLQDRLKELVAITSNEVLDKIIGDKDQFEKDIRWSRNYYTHYSTDLKKKALKGTALFHLSEKLKALLVCALLFEIGIPIEKIEQMLENNKYKLFNHLIFKF